LTNVPRRATRSAEGLGTAVGRIIDSIPTSEERDAQPASMRRTAKTAERG